jgi:osmoprotectant transport system permease protein
LSAQLALLPDYLTGHLLLTLIALALGAAISVPLGIWATRNVRLEPAVLGVASIIQTIPGLALLAVMVPALAMLSGLTSTLLGVELRSIGYLPAIIALTLYSILPMLRNTVTGIAGIDPAVIEAAQAVGMTDRQQLWRVELPLALPVIIAGFRTATVWVVGMATLSTPVGATSLGNYIFTGLQTRNYVAVLTGCVAAAVLALLLDGLIRWLEVGFQRRRRAWIAAPLAIMLALCVATGASVAARWAGGGPRPIVIGAKTFTEQYILSELLALRITRETGLPTRSVSSLGSTVAFDALRSGEIDVYVDYSGTIWATIMQRESLPSDRGRVLDDVREYLAREHGVLLVAALGFENTYALGMGGDQARALGVDRISQLAAMLTASSSARPGAWTPRSCTRPCGRGRST